MEISYNRKEIFLTALGRSIPCTNLVRNELNGERLPSQVVKTENKDGSIGVPYQPRGFPVGNWHIVAALPKTDGYEAPFFLSTDAWQLVDQWIASDGSYVCKAGVQVADHGYGLHNSTSSTTLGCIRILDSQDLLDLVAACNEAWANNESVNLTVKELA